MISVVVHYHTTYLQLQPSRDEQLFSILSLHITTSKIASLNIITGVSFVLKKMCSCSVTVWLRQYSWTYMVGYMFVDAQYEYVWASKCDRKSAGFWHSSKTVRWWKGVYLLVDTVASFTCDVILLKNILSAKNKTKCSEWNVFASW